jgi:hypothetical protein
MAHQSFDRNLYLDRRQPEWLQYEKTGQIFYDCGLDSKSSKENAGKLNPRVKETMMVMVDDELTEVIRILCGFPAAVQEAVLV